MLTLENEHNARVCATWVHAYDSHQGWPGLGERSNLGRWLERVLLVTSLRLVVSRPSRLVASQQRRAAMLPDRANPMRSRARSVVAFSKRLIPATFSILQTAS
jgi:hypothetical protein